MKKIIISMLSVASIAIASTTPYSGNINAQEYDKVIKNACYQKNLVQKIYKNYIMTKINDKFKNKKNQIETNISMFEDNLNKINKFIKVNNVTNDVILEDLKKQDILFYSFKQDLKKELTKEESSFLKNNVAELVEVSDNACVDLITYSKDKSKLVIAETGELASIAYKVTCSYILKNESEDINSTKEGMKESMLEFDDSMEELVESETTTKEIKDILNETNKIFLYLKVMSNSESKFIPTLIAKNAEKIEQNMVKATKLYLIELKKLKDRK